ncbi:MAG: tripartite tricarboxylate transporter substrate binding protein [Rhodospirillales bacterium]|nr:tripartite tricarboxylate transporter substrate binding protein [Rhodospirillales bacterium]
MRRRAVVTGLAAAGLAAPSIVGAQGDWPNKPVRIVIAYPPGGPTDLATRITLDKVATALGQPFIFDNKGGASGAIGAEFVKNQAPDGYTFLGMTIAMVAITPHLQPLPYHPEKDFAHVARMATSMGALAAHPSMPFDDVAGLVAYAKANPGKVNWGSSGMATITHLYGEMLKLEAGINITHVPYKGSAQALQDLLAGQVQLQFDQLTLPHIKAGKLKGLASLSDTRWHGMPQMRTLREQGYGKNGADSWYGLMAPAATPRPIVDKLAKAIGESLANPDTVAKLDQAGQRATFLDPDAMKARIAVESAAFADVIKRGNIKV